MSRSASRLSGSVATTRTRSTHSSISSSRSFPRLIEENADLRQRVAELDQELAEAKKAPRSASSGAPAAQAKPEPARVVELRSRSPHRRPRPSRLPRPRAVTPSMQAAKVLGLAQEMADRLTSDAKTESEQLVAQRADQLRAAGLATRARAVGSDDRRRTPEVRRDARRMRRPAPRRSCVRPRRRPMRSRPTPRRSTPRSWRRSTSSVRCSKAESSSSRRSSASTASRLKSYLESQLEELEQRGSAVPVDGGQDAFNQSNSARPTSVPRPCEGHQLTER